jgi:hypothetical protein
MMLSARLLTSVAVFCLASATLADNADTKERNARAERAVCLQLKAQIDDAQKSLSYDEVKLQDEDSAIRANLIASEEATEMQTIQANLSTMRTSGCAPYGHAISKTKYAINATICITAEAQRDLAVFWHQPEPDMTSCDRSKWTAVE